MQLLKGQKMIHTLSCKYIHCKCTIICRLSQNLKQLKISVQYTGSIFILTPCKYPSNVCKIR